MVEGNSGTPYLIASRKQKEKQEEARDKIYTLKTCFQ
jgi:hypothetical protein